MMMSFCKKSVHSFLSLTIPMNNNSNNTDPTFQEKPSFSSTAKCLGLSSGGGGGLGLITATGDVCRTPNVLESATVKSTMPPPPSSPVKKDPGGIGFLDDVGGGVDGLMSCTESLGFESSDERRVDDEIDEFSPAAMTSYKWRKIGERTRRRREVKKFPPPLSSFNHNGQPCFFLRPVRKDGRLELTEVRIDRPEILRACREDGRLRLHLVRDDQELEEINEESEVLQDQENKEQDQQEEEEEEEEEVKENQEDQEEEREGEEWKFPVTGEGFRRCHELSTHHHDYHHHHHHLWRQHCVTTS